MGSFFASVVLSLVVAGSALLFCSAAIQSLRCAIHRTVALIAFLTTSIIVAGLTAKCVRSRTGQSSQKTLVNAIPAPVWSALPDGSRDFHSQRWREFTGLSAEEASGEGWSTVVHPEERAALLEKWRLALAAREPFESEARERSAKGNTAGSWSAQSRYATKMGPLSNGMDQILTSRIANARQKRSAKRSSMAGGLRA